MSRIVIEKADLPPGTHVATLRAIDEVADRQFGKLLLWRFVNDDGEFVRRTGGKYKPGKAAYDMLLALVGGDVAKAEKVADTKELVGKQYEIELGVEEKDGDTFTVLVSAKPYVE